MITVVDDDQSARDGIVDLVNSRGFDVEAFKCAEDLLNSARVETTRCLITDMRLPGMTGLDLHERLVASGRAVSTIIITAFPQDADRERAEKAGVICYLKKPFDEDDLVACILSALGSSFAGRRKS